MEEWLIVSVKEIAKHQGNHTILCGLKTTFTHKKTSVFYCQISYFQNKLNKLSHKSWLKKKKKVSGHVLEYCFVKSSFLISQRKRIAYLNFFCMIYRSMK